MIKLVFAGLIKYNFIRKKSRTALKYQIRKMSDRNGKERTTGRAGGKPVATIGFTGTMTGFSVAESVFTVKADIGSRPEQIIAVK